MLKKYRIGFSLKGFIAFFIIMLPNIIWMINPPDNDVLATNSSDIAWINTITVISQWAMIIILILLIYKTGETEKNRKHKIVCAFCTCIYYISWVFYYLGVVNPIMLVGMAVFPCCFFITFILWQRIYPALIPAVIFSVLHIGSTALNIL